MKFREHRGGLAASMETVVWITNRDMLIEHIRKLLAPFDIVVASEDVTIAPYGFDERIGWDTHIVTIKDHGVVGFTDGPVT